MANEKEIKQMAKKYGLEVDSIEGNPNAGLQANLIGDKEALRKFMTSDDYGMDDEDVDFHIGEFGSDVEDKDVKDDYEFSRKTYKDLIHTGTRSMDVLAELARESEHPRAFEVLSQTIKNLKP